MKKYINLARAIIAGAALTGCDDFLNDNRYPLTSIVDSPAYWSNTNNVQLQCDPFFKAFNIKPGDKLYLPAEEQVIIW